MDKVIKFKDLGFLKRVHHALFVSPFFLFQTKRNIYNLTNSVRQHQFEDNTQIYRYKLFDLSTSTSLFQWQSISDKEFGGSSEASIQFNQTHHHLTLRGNISTQDRQKIITMPFIGLLQKQQFNFKVGLFNSLAVTIKTDGLPLQVQIGFLSPIYGKLSASGRIISKLSEYKTYELPFLNFVINGEEQVATRHRKQSDRYTIKQIIQQQCMSPQSFTIDNVAFRLHGTTDASRQISLKKIELVRTKRGTILAHQQYRKPYFYVTNEWQSMDRERSQIDTGDIVFLKTNDVQ